MGLWERLVFSGGFFAIFIPLYLLIVVKRNENWLEAKNRTEKKLFRAIMSLYIGDVEIDQIDYPLEKIYKNYQSVGISSSGIVKIATYDLEEQYIVLRLKDKDKATAELLREYIRAIAEYSLNTIVITADEWVDLGTGDGLAITVRYWSDNFEEVSNKQEYHEFKFTFRVEQE